SLAIRAAEAAVHPNFPDADTILIVELDGPAAEVSALFDVVVQICRRHGAATIDVAGTDEHRARIWRGRKAAFAAMGRVSPNYYVQDGVVPRTRLPEVLSRIRDLERRSGLRIGNVFHAGDGNLHPLICYDERVPGEADKAVEVAAEILSYCIEAGGSLTGEHGIGADKSQYMPTMFEGGAALADVNRALAPHRQWLPLDPPFAERATIGGILATNDSGPLRHRYGTPRDVVIGVQLATTDGVLSKAGGRVVKNVAGYDLSKLVCGSFGSLAAIVSATFKLAPRAAASKTVVVDVPD